jgi:hypothetical protein
MEQLQGLSQAESQEFYFSILFLKINLAPEAGLAQTKLFVLLPLHFLSSISCLQIYPLPQKKIYDVSFKLV